MKCYICKRQMPKRNRATITFPVAIGIGEIKYKSFTRSQTHNCHRHCKEDYIIKQKILKAAGHSYDGFYFEEAEVIKFKFDKKPIYPLYKPKPAIFGTMPQFIIADDLENDLTYDPKIMTAFWDALCKEEVNKTLGGTNAATSTTDQNKRDSEDAVRYAINGVQGLFNRGC